MLLTSQLGDGHWRPLAGLAVALEAAGHEVAFASTPACCATISRHGFACIPVGVDDDGRAGIASGEARRDVDPAADVWRSVFAGRRLDQMLPGIFAFAREWRPDLIVREISEFSGALVGEALKVPHVALQVSAWRPHLIDLVAAALRRYIQALRLPSIGIPELLYHHLLLSPIPPVYRDPARPYPRTTYPIQPLGYDLQPETTGPREFVAARHRPRIYATLGTAYNRYPDLFAVMLEAVSRLDVECIVTTGADPAKLGLSVPPNARVLSYLPQSQVFPHCDVVISHAGFGTVQAALCFGLPQILLPIAADQPDNAALCAAHGVGILMEPDARSTVNLCRAIERVLGGSGYRERAAAWRQAIEALPPPATVVRRLEALAGAG